MKKLHLLTILLAAVAACSSPKEDKQKIQLIFETDMGNDVDDALALDMIFKYVEDGAVDLLAISTNKTDVESLEYLDIMKTWYGYPEIPLGTVKHGVECPCAFPFARRAADLKKADGSPKYERTHSDYSQIPESSKLYRKLLSQAADTSVVIASVGFTTNLAQLLETQPDEYSHLSGQDLVKKKVKFLSIMGCYLADTVTLEFNVTIDKVSSHKLFKDWPTKMFFSPAELGCKIMYPGERIQEDFYWANGAHPMVDGYSNYFAPHYDRPCWDLTSVLYAVEGGSYYNISGPGRITMAENGVTRFNPDENGLAYVLSVDSDQQVKALVDRFVELTHRIPKAFR